MEEKTTALIFLGIVAFTGVVGLITALSPSLTGSVSSYQKFPNYGGVKNEPDPHTQYLNIDEGFCNKYIRDDGSFFRLVDRLCQELNHGRQKREGDCRYKAQLDAEINCAPAQVFVNVQQPRYVTGMIAVDPLGCARLADDYDAVFQQTFERAGVPRQTISMIDSCTGTADAAVRQTYSPEGPLREYTRTAFANGDITGSVTGDETGEGDVRYVLCAQGTARVLVSGTSVCNTMR